MFLEGGLQLADDWTFQPGMNLAPVIGRVSVAQPLVREADSTGKADPAIDYQDTAVRAPIHTINPPGGDRMIIGERTARFLESLDICIIQRQAGSNAVEQHANADAGARALGQRVTKLCRNLAGMEQERLEVDSFARPLMASSIAGKIIFPLCRSSILFPRLQWIGQGMSGRKELGSST